MDVLAHCIEAITNRNYNPYGYIFGKEGIRLAMKWLPIAVKEPKNEEAREKMALAANLGGMAISACGCSIGHAFAQAFGARNHIPHGLGCAWSLPATMIHAAKFSCRSDLEEVAEAMSVPSYKEIGSMELAEIMSGIIVDMMKDMKIKSLRESGFTLEDCMAVADVFDHEAAYGNAPGTPSLKENQEFIQYSYNAY